MTKRQEIVALCVCYWSLRGLYVRSKVCFYVNSSNESYVNIMNSFGVRLQPMLMFELPATDWTLKRGILPAFDPQMLLPRIPPFVSLAALVTKPGPQVWRWKKRPLVVKSFVRFAIFSVTTLKAHIHIYA